MQFRFPQSTKDLSVIDSLQKVKLLLKEEADERKLKITYRLVKRKDNFYFYCSRCDSKLQYKKNLDSERQTFRLCKIINLHRHQFSNFRETSKTFVNFLQDLPKGMSLKSAKILSLKTFSISQKQFYYYYNKIYSPKLTIQELLTYFESMNVDVYVEPFEISKEQEPEIMVLISERMKKNFAKYPEYCAFDCTFNLIKSAYWSSYKVGIIAGQSLSKRICPFAIVLCRQQTKSTFSMVLQAFEKSMGKHPAVYVSDENIAFIQSVKEITSQNNALKHYYDIFHVLKNVKKKVQDKKIIGELSRISKLKNFDMFERNVLEVLQKINPSDKKIVERFIDNGDKYIFATLPMRFIGFSSSDSFLQKCNDIIKQNIPNQKRFTTCVIKLFQIMEDLGKKCDKFQIQKSPLQMFYALPELKILRSKMDFKVIKELCKQISKVSKNQIVRNQNQFYFVRDQFFSFKAKVNDKDSSCNCHYSIKSGIPCQHILTVLIRKGIQIENHINPRWLAKISEIESTQEKFKFEWRGRGKKTRRNIMR